MKLIEKSLMVPIEKVDNWNENPRKIKVEDFIRLKNQIAKLGVYKPLLCEAVGDRYQALGGNMRIRALRELNQREIWITLVEVKDQAERVELSLSDNDRAGYYDNAALADQLKGLDIALANYKVDLTAPMIDLSTVLDNSVEPIETEDDIPETIPPVSKRGDIFKLGDHRIMCGDSTDPADFAKLMNGKKADMIFTDPPYNVDYSGRGKNTKEKILNDNMAEGKFREFLTAAFTRMRENSKPAAGLYSCYASRTHREFEDALNAAGYKVRNQIIWVKIVASMGWGDYRWKHEPILYCAPADGGIEFYGDRKQYTEWTEEKSDKQLLIMVKKMIEIEEQGQSTVWRFNREMNYKHPTQKPVALVEKAIKNSSRQGQIVLDPFLGSGSTLIAADKMARACYGLELDPHHIDTILARYAMQTGQTAVKL
jgi:DNA modification methylase